MIQLVNQTTKYWYKKQINYQNSDEFIRRLISMNTRQKMVIRKVDYFPFVLWNVNGKPVSVTLLSMNQL